MIFRKISIGSLSIAAALLAFTPSALAKRKTASDIQQVRADYISRIQQQNAVAPTDTTLGSLWTPGGLLTDLSADYKAHRLNDIINIVVAQQTTAQASGDVTSQRAFDTQSGISGLAGRIKTGGVDPLLKAQSATNLKGKGSSNASSMLQTNLAGQVIAVLANGNMVVEAQRTISVNNQKETMIVRGVLRPGDVAADNTAPSRALANLEIELKGKGVISDATRPPNPLVRALLWIVGF